MDMMRHVGKIANTDQRCVVAFMQIPNREDHALVIPTDTLPPRYEQAVMDVLKSPEGQNEECFALALSRRLMPDTGKDILATLHEQAMLVAVPVYRVLMLPLPNQPIKLSDILTQLGRHTRTPDEALYKQQSEKFNRHDQNMRAESAEQKRNIAQNLLLEARMLEAEAKKKRDAAYGFDPSARPVQQLSPQESAGIAHYSGTIHDPMQMTLESLLAETPIVDELPENGTEDSPHSEFTGKINRFI
jgi:hypothetical protein